MSKTYQIEICAANIQSAIAAKEGGADRIELCDNLYEGGTTPSYAMIKAVADRVRIDTMVMIRPRGGDFCYNDLEFSIMKEDIRMCKDLGVRGVVLGILKPTGEIDSPRTKELVDLAKPLEVTFHRAFDMTPKPLDALEAVIRTGADRILTTGHKNQVPDGLDLVRTLMQEANNRIRIMPGSGIRESNIQLIRDATGAKEFHLTAREAVESEMTYRKEEILMGGIPQIPEYKIFITSKNTVKNIVYLVSKS
jgi:copper homeostasis protein